MQNKEQYVTDFENINQFNKYFLYDNVKDILSLYEKHNNIWHHPLLLNYSYCTFCKEKTKSRYNNKTLKQFHSNISPGKFLYEKKIKLRHIKGKNAILSKRRFIHSNDKYKNSFKDYEHFLSNQYDNESDTDIYVHKKKRNLNSREIQHTFPSYRQFDKRAKSFALPKNNTFKPPKQKISVNNINNNKLYTNINAPDSNCHRRDTFFSTIFKNFGRNDSKKKTSPEIINFDTKIDVILNTSPKSSNAGSRIGESKNECCDLCLQDINDKFVLSCGDFYCRDCITGVIKACLNDISKFDKMVCPKEICGEPIQEEVIQKLLSKEEFAKYIKLKTRIEGLKNRMNIPCPYPDCESFGNVNDITHDILKCDNNHIFCVKCLSILKEENVLEHVCEDKKNDETMKFLTTNKFMKQCPNCHTWGVREPGGCNNMTCQNIWCNYEYCWICERQYDSAHYKNPFSVCFGLGNSNYESKLSKYKSIRIAKCILIFLLAIFIVLPIVLIFFSFIVIGFYVVTFVLDDSSMKNIRIKNQNISKAFHIVMYCFYIMTSIACIPVGYLSISAAVIGIPSMCIVNWIRNKKEEEEE